MYIRLGVRHSWIGSSDSGVACYAKQAHQPIDLRHATLPLIAKLSKIYINSNVGLKRIDRGGTRWVSKR